jgi:hypothetical protein
MARNARARGSDRGPGEGKDWSDEDRKPPSPNTAPAFAQPINGDDHQPVPPDRQVWTLVFCGSKPLGITILRAAGLWVPLPFTDPRAEEIVNRLLMERDDE